MATTACDGSTSPVGPAVVDPGPLTTTPAVPDAEHIYLANADGSGIVRLTAGTRPAWSFDGQRLVFERDGDVRVINIDGSGDTRVAAGGSPSWSPDGVTIAYTNGDGIGLVTFGGVPLGTLIRHDFRDDTYKPWDMGVSKPAWSPDGTRIAFEHLGDGDMQPAQVYVVGADGSNPRLVTQIPEIRFAESDPSWSPDGSKVVYWSYGYGVASTDAAGGVPNTLYDEFPHVAYGAKPVWSSRGVIAFTRDRLSPGTAAIWAMPATGGPNAAKLLIANAYDAAWSPSGARIAFTSRRVE